MKTALYVWVGILVAIVLVGAWVRWRDSGRPEPYDRRSENRHGR